MRVRERTRMGAAGDEAGEVRHVDHEVGTDLVGDLAEDAEVDDAGIGGAAGDDELRAMLLGELAHLVDVDPMVVAAHAVGHWLEPFARHVHRRAMREMAAGGEVEPKEGVAGLQQGHEGCRIGGGAGVRLDVGEFTSEKLGNAFNSKAFGNIDILAAAVIALARQAFRVLVGEDRALRLQHRLADDVLRGDQFDLVALAAELEPDSLGHFRIGLRDRGGKQR